MKRGGVSYRAIIESSGRQIASKNFSRRSKAGAWAARIEADRDCMAALCNPDDPRTLASVANEGTATPAKNHGRDHLVW